MEKTAILNSELPDLDFEDLASSEEIGSVDAGEVAMDATDKQQILLQIVLSFQYTRILFGGAVGGAKTWGWLFILYLLCRMYPGSRWGIIRKNRKVIRQNTLKSFWRSCPRPFFHRSRFNSTYMTATATNGSEIFFLGENIDKDPELTDFDGLEANGVVIEEAHECSEELFIKLNDRVGRWVLPSGIELPAFIFLSCNPHQGWLKKMFYTPNKEGRLEFPYCFLQSLPEDNPHLPQAYWDSLNELKKLAPNIWRKRVKGSWEAEDDVQQLIMWATLWECEPLIEFTDEERESEEFIRGMGVDVGRYGPDPSVWKILEGIQGKGFNKIHSEKYPQTSIPQVEQKTKELIEEFDLDHSRVVFDVVGLGAGGYDHLVEDGYDIQPFSGGDKALEQYVPSRDGKTKKLIFFNMNSQASWMVKTEAEKGHLGGIDEDLLREDLGVYRYDFKGERTIHIWGKDLIKKKLHRSPDDGDSYKYAVWGMTYDTVEPMPGMVTI